MIVSLKEDVSKIELHYFFSDSSHSMNALIRNKCEINLLGMIKEIAGILNARVQIETEALTEGGLKERYVLRGKSQFLRTLTVAIFHYVLPLEVDIEKVVNEENKEETKKNIENLRKELKELEKNESKSIDLQNTVQLFRNNLKIIKLKSNFYRHIDNCEKATKLSVQQINNEGMLVAKPNIISRKKFGTYMLIADTLKPETDDKAVIEIISPVLKVSSYKWKGIYLATGKIINFAMKDGEFKNEVITQGILFKNGTRIECVLESSRKMSEFGEVTVTGYTVTTVVRMMDEEASVDIQHSKPVKKKKEPELQQLDLFNSLF